MSVAVAPAVESGLPEVVFSQEVPDELLDLMDRVRGLPGPFRRELEPIVSEIQEHARFRGRVLSIARDALLRLRLDLEMTRFDLDVSRQERDELRTQLNLADR